MSWQATTVFVYRSHIQQMKDQARRVWPMEACGLLLGKIEKQTAYATELILTANIEKSTVSFTIDPQVLLDVYLRAEREQKELIGIFHSHPADARPSGVDLKFMKMNPVVWFIVSMPSEKYAAYQLRNEEPVEVRVVVQD